MLPGIIQNDQHTYLEYGGMAPKHLHWESDGEYVAHWILLLVTLEDTLHCGTRLFGCARVDVDAVGIARPEVKSQERLENARLCDEKVVQYFFYMK